MTKWFAVSAILTLAVGIVMQTGCRNVDTADDGGATYSPPRTPDGHPDFQGIWQVRNSANWNLQHHAGSYKTPAGLGVVVDPKDGSIPYQEWALEQK